MELTAQRKANIQEAYKNAVANLQASVECEAARRQHFLDAADKQITILRNAVNEAVVSPERDEDNDLLPEAFEFRTEACLYFANLADIAEKGKLGDEQTRKQLRDTANWLISRPLEDCQLNA